MPDVNPTILGWARETAGLSLEEAAKALGIGDARGQTGAERLAELEQGKRSPTRSQLTKMAQRYPLPSRLLSRSPAKKWG